MIIKSKIKALLRPFLAESPNISPTQRRAQERVNYVTDQASLPQRDHGGFVIRILATDRANASIIEDCLVSHMSSLGIESIETIGKAIEASQSNKDQSSFSHSVLLRMRDESMLHELRSHKYDCSNFLRHAIYHCDNSKREKIVVDFSSPNIAKPFHLGHLKSTILGNFLANVHQAIGNDVVRLNYLGDWGTQFGILSLGMSRFGDRSSFVASRSPLRYLLELYIKANDEAKRDEMFFAEAKKRMLTLHREGDGSEVRFWEEARKISIHELMKSYDDIGIRFDAYEFESDYVTKSIELVRKLESQNLVQASDDGLAQMTVTRNEQTINVPLLRSDGSSLYLSRDLAAALERKKKYSFDKMLYVVGVDQEKHFFLLKEILERAGERWANDLIHVKMGKVLGMSSRNGKFVLLSDIIEEASNRYMETTKNTPTSKVTRDHLTDVGRHLGLSALFVYDMRRPRTAHYTFDWDDILSSGSNSGVNVQATHARLCALITKAQESGIGSKTLENMNLDAIRSVDASILISNLSEFDTAFQASFLSKDPFHLVRHALRLCRAINRARRSKDLRVLGTDEHVAKTRLLIFQKSMEQLRLVIELIGLKPLEKV